MGMSFSHIYVNTLDRVRKILSRAKPGLSLARCFCATLFITLLHTATLGQAATSQAYLYNLNLEWNPSSSPGISGYRIYYGSSSGNFTNTITLGNISNGTVPGLTGGIAYYFAVTSVDTNGVESIFSNELNYQLGLPGAKVTSHRGGAGQFQLSVTGATSHTYNIQATTNLLAWTNIGAITLGTNGALSFTDTSAGGFARRFYRTIDAGY